MRITSSNIKKYKGKIYSGKKYEAQGVIEGEASVLEIFESFYKIPFYPIEYEDFLEFMEKGTSQYSMSFSRNK